MGEAVFVTVLRVVTTITSVLVCLAPLPDILRVRRQRNTDGMSVLPLVMIFSNSHIWAMYGYLVGNFFPLFAQCVIGEAANLVFICIYYRFSSDRGYILKLAVIAAIGLTIMTTYVILATTDVTNETHHHIEKVMGFVAVAINICMYGSPLEVMASVVRTKSAAALPIAFSAMSFVNCALWVVFGAVDHDMFVLTPNAIATGLSAVQIGLYLIYRPNQHTADTEDASIDKDPTRMSSPATVFTAV